MKWIVSELTGDHPSRLRRPLQGERGIAPLPIVLRELGDLWGVESLAQIFDLWWGGLSSGKLACVYVGLWDEDKARAKMEEFAP